MIIFQAGEADTEVDRLIRNSACAIVILPIALGAAIFDLTPSFLFIALGFLFAMRAVSASRRADSLYARAAAAALAEGDDPIAMSEAA